METRVWIIIILSIILTIFLIIGITMYLCGCHDILQPNCLRYWKTQGKVTNHFTIFKTCTRCTASLYIGKTTTCIRYENYDCYDSFVTFEFTMLVNRNCDLYITTNSSRNTALSEAQNNYAISNVYPIYVNKSSYECSSINNVSSIALAGFVFLILSALVLIGLIIAIFNNRSWKKKQLEKVTENGINNNNLAIIPNLHPSNQTNHENNFIAEKPIELQNIHPNEINYNAPPLENK